MEQKSSRILGDFFMIDNMDLNSFLRLASYHEKIDKFSAKFNQVFTTKRRV